MIVSALLPLLLTLNSGQAQTSEPFMAEVKVANVKAAYFASKGLTFAFGEHSCATGSRIVISSSKGEPLFDSSNKAPEIVFGKLGTEGRLLTMTFHPKDKVLGDVIEKIEFRPDNSIVLKINIDWNSKETGHVDWIVAELNSDNLNKSSWHAECTNYTYPKGVFSFASVGNALGSNTTIVKNFWTLDVQSDKLRIRIAPAQDSADLLWVTQSQERITSKVQSSFMYRNLELLPDSSFHKTVRLDVSSPAK